MRATGVLFRMLLAAAAVFLTATAFCADVKSSIYQVGDMAPRDSALKVAVGDKAPEFELPAVAGGKVSLAEYRGKKNVVLSFVPAAWTPVCSGQWPRYDADREFFEKNNAVLLGITVDNIPSLYSWTKQIDMDGGGMWFPVLSDFYPHGEVASRYGVLRSSGVSERAVFIIDMEGIIRYIEVYDINRMPMYVPFEKALQEMGRKN